MGSNFSQGRLESVQTLAHLGAYVDYETSKFKTPLIAATEAGQITMIALLLELGAHAPYETRDQKTALAWASSSGQMEAMEILLQAEADMEAGSPDTPAVV